MRATLHRRWICALLLTCGGTTGALASPEDYSQYHTLGFSFSLSAENGPAPWGLQGALGKWNTAQSGRALHGGRDADGSDPSNPCNYVTAPWRVDGNSVDFSASTSHLFTTADSFDPDAWYNASNAANLASSVSWNFDPGSMFVSFGSVHGGPARISYSGDNYSMSVHNASGSAWNQPISPTQDLTCITSSGPCPFYMDTANGKMGASESFTAAFGSVVDARNLSLQIDMSAYIGIGSSISYGTLVGWRNDICPIPCPCTINAACVGTPPKINLTTTMTVTVNVYKNTGNGSQGNFSVGSLISSNTFSGTITSGAFTFAGTGEFAGITCSGGCAGAVTDTADLCDGNGQTPIGVHDTDSPYVDSIRTIPISSNRPITVIITRTISTTQN